MEYIDFVNEDRFDEMEELSESLFGKDFMADDRFERFKQMAKDEFGVSVVKVDWNKEEVWDAIHELSDIRAGYNLFDDEEASKYHACSLAIKALREVIGEPIKE